MNEQRMFSTVTGAEIDLVKDNGRLRAEVERLNKECTAHVAAIHYQDQRAERAEAALATAMKDSEALVRLIELIRAMDLQAQREVGADDAIIGYRFNTGCWHRILGMVAGHECAAWIRTPEGQARIREASERARATIEELEMAQAIDWSKYRALAQKEVGNG